MNWIKCSERMPDFGVVVLVFADGFRYAGWLELIDKEGPLWMVFRIVDRNGMTDRQAFGRAYSVTHWCPLPEPPHE